MTEDNAILAHDYSSSSVEKPFRAHGEVSVFGSIGSILGDEIKLQVEGESPFVSRITPLESQGDLLSLEVDLLGHHASRGRVGPRPQYSCLEMWRRIPSSRVPLGSQGT